MSSTFTIVACGESARNWTPEGYCLGVNDAWKWGKPTDGLLICNRPSEFKGERFTTIINSKPKDFYTHKANWSEFFPKWIRVRLHPWAGTLHQWNRSDGPSAYTQNTSPIIAITLAYNLGAKDIILWGVDFKNHHLFNEANPETDREVLVYKEVIWQMGERGVNVWLGAKGTMFDEYLKVKERIE